MEITELPPTPVVLPAAGELIHIRTQGLVGLRPEIPLSELTAGRLDRLLELIGHWITDVRAHPAERRTPKRPPKHNGSP
jgi:hypothetical protein